MRPEIDTHVLHTGGKIEKFVQPDNSLPRGFSGGDTGEFWGDDTDEGRPIKVVFRWTRIDHDNARWEQSFSLDGKEWEKNWVIEHRRVRG